MNRFHQKQLEMEKAAFKERYEEQERCQQQLQEQRLKLMREFKQQQLRNSETLARMQSVTVIFLNLTRLDSTLLKTVARRIKAIM